MEDYTPTEEETTAEKLRLIKLVRSELKEHGLVDLTAFVNKQSRVGFKHSGFVRSLAYRLEEMGISEVIPQEGWTQFYIKRNIYSKRHPILFALILAAIGVVFSIIAGGANALITSRINKAQTDKKIEKKLKSIKENMKVISDSTSTLRNGFQEVRDTSEKYQN